MKEELTCITCPLGCRLVAERIDGGGAEGGLEVSGNRCARGAVYAREELLAPKRVVTATCRIRLPGSGAPTKGEASATTRPLSPSGRAEGAPRRLPCKTSAPFPKERVGELLAEIYALEVELPVDRGAVILADALGSGIDLVATRGVSS